MTLCDFFVSCTHSQKLLYTPPSLFTHLLHHSQLPWHQSHIHSHFNLKTLHLLDCINKTHSLSSCLFFPDEARTERNVVPIYYSCLTNHVIANIWHHVIASLLRSLSTSQFLENAQLLVVPHYQSFLRFMNLVYLWTTTWEQVLLLVTPLWDTEVAEKLSEQNRFFLLVFSTFLNLLYNHLIRYYIHVHRERDRFMP